MVNNFQKFALVTVGASLSFISFGSSQAQATAITYNFQFAAPTEFLPAPGAVGKGSFTFDDALINPNAAFQTIQLLNNPNNPVGGFSFTFARTFQASESYGFPQFPQVDLTRGQLNGITADFFDINDSKSVLNSSSVTLSDKNLVLYDAKSDIYSSANITYTLANPTPTSVPEPSAMSGLLILSLGGLLKRRMG